MSGLKANYEKPMVLFESFEMNQSIASGCGVPWGGTSLGKPNHASKSLCGWDMGNFVIWVDNTEVCDAWKYGMSYDENSDVSGICYNTPSGGYTIFNS